MVELKGVTARAVPITIIKSQPPSSNKGFGSSSVSHLGGENIGLFLMKSQPSWIDFGNGSPKNTMSGFIGPLQISPFFHSVMVTSPVSKLGSEIETSSYRNS